ncbi:MAG: hypothetical protein ACRCVN_02455 [Spirochaetia bacterium]
MKDTEWQDELYITTYESTSKAIEFRRKNDKTYTPDELERQLEAMYVIDGNNYGGRSLAGQLDLEATIAAMQVALNQWLKEHQA